MACRQVAAHLPALDQCACNRFRAVSLSRASIRKYRVQLQAAPVQNGLLPGDAEHAGAGFDNFQIGRADLVRGGGQSNAQQDKECEQDAFHSAPSISTL